MKELLLLVVLGVSQATPTGYIVGGTTVAEEGKWPWMGSLRAYDIYTCGITLISPSWGLTSGHCVEYTQMDYSFNFGSNNRSKDTVLVGSKRIILHEDYNKGSGFYPNDVALVEFDAPVTGANIAPVSLADKGSDHVGNEDCWAVGWGSTVAGTNLPELLTEAGLGLVTGATCRLQWDAWIGDGHICSAPGGSQVCEGDSGGPHVCRVQGGQYVAVGIMSWGPAGCVNTAPGVLSSVAYYRDWIEANTGL